MGPPVRRARRPNPAPTVQRDGVGVQWIAGPGQSRTNRVPAQARSLTRSAPLTGAWRPTFGASRRLTVNFRRPSAAAVPYIPHNSSRRPGGIPYHGDEHIRTNLLRYEPDAPASASPRYEPDAPASASLIPEGIHSLARRARMRHPDRGPASSRRAACPGPGTVSSRDPQGGPGRPRGAGTGGSGRDRDGSDRRRRSRTDSVAPRSGVGEGISPRPRRPGSSARPSASPSVDV
jgi:hypothetical protein